MDTVGCHRLWLVTVGYNGCWLQWVMAGYGRLQQVSNSWLQQVTAGYSRLQLVAAGSSATG